jgi:hypothetical protein
MIFEVQYHMLWPPFILQLLEQSSPSLPSVMGDTARTAAVCVGATAVGAFALYKRPRLVRNYAAGAVLTGGTVQLALAAMTAHWVRFGAYLEKVE